ncbi:MAG: hypothetical protein GY859_34105, partial [Desulfobacterales bacterium]|nr:hypothetical protein [Desulfobacterales bacterium]
FYGVWGNSGTSVFALGTEGAILRYKTIDDSCIALDSRMNFNTPCLDLSGTRYRVRFNNIGNGAWAPDMSSLSASAETGACMHFDNALGFTVPCLNLSGTRFRVTFDYTGASYLWTPDESSIAINE